MPGAQLHSFEPYLNSIAQGFDPPSEVVGSGFPIPATPDQAIEEFSGVEVKIACKHGSLGENQQEYITRKSEKLLTYFERVTAINVTVSYEHEKERSRVRVEILVDAEHKHNFVAFEVGDEVSPTYDAALHKMEQQIRKYKEKVQDHRRDRPLNELAGGE